MAGFDFHLLWNISRKWCKLISSTSRQVSLAELTGNYEEKGPIDLCISRFTNSCCIFPGFKILKPSLYCCMPLAFRNNSALCYRTEEQRSSSKLVRETWGCFQEEPPPTPSRTPRPVWAAHHLQPRASGCAPASPRTLRAALVSRFEPPRADPCKHTDFPAPLLTAPHSHLGAVREEDFLWRPVRGDANSKPRKTVSRWRCLRVPLLHNRMGCTVQHQY